MKQKSIQVIILLISIMLLSCGLTDRFLGGNNNSAADQDVNNETTAIIETET